MSGEWFSAQRDEVAAAEVIEEYIKILFPQNVSSFFKVAISSFESSYLSVKKELTEAYGNAGKVIRSQRSFHLTRGHAVSEVSEHHLNVLLEGLNKFDGYSDDEMKAHLIGGCFGVMLALIDYGVEKTLPTSHDRNQIISMFKDVARRLKLIADSKVDFTKIRDRINQIKERKSSSGILDRDGELLFTRIADIFT